MVSCRGQASRRGFAVRRPAPDLVFSVQRGFLDRTRFVLFCIFFNRSIIEVSARPFIRFVRLSVRFAD